MFTHTLSVAHERWLTPAEPKAGPCRCKLCGTNYDSIAFFDLAPGVVCEECTDKHTYPFDVYPEIEEMQIQCSICGQECETAAILIDGIAYCPECRDERKVDL